MLKRSPKKILPVTALVLLLSACESTGPSSFEFDYASAKPSDFNGRWEGYVDCEHYKEWKPFAEVVIKDGVGTLANFGNWGKTATADLDLSNGKIRWRGTYDNHKGGTNTPYSVTGKWVGSQFKVSGFRELT